jgi:stage V sporulation protein R
LIPEETNKLEKAIEKISAKAKEFGLDFFDMRFEVCPADIIYTFGAYGMPTRYAHWSFGKSFHRMKTQYDYNLSKIYELVINTDPCYAFLLEGNSLVQNKLVAAHVFAHNDFFKNNCRFGHTSRNMLDTMAASAERIAEYEHKYGREKVEKCLDAALALQEHIDPHVRIKKAERVKKIKRETPYDDLWNLNGELQTETEDKAKKFPPEPEKDVLGFIMENSRTLEDWQRDIISVVRNEMLYFWPQMETKIMNEGWATYWHLRLMREINLTEDEVVEFAKMHAGVIQKSRMSINPYLIGLKIWEDIEKRWNEPNDEEREKYGRPGGEGRQKMFEVRANENDLSFLRNYLTKELAEDLDLYLYKKVYTKWQVTETSWETVRDGMIALLTNCGYPYILVEEGDYRKNGELHLKHSHDGRDLDIYYLEKTLPHVYKLWGRPVHLETTVDNKNMLYSYNGEKVTKKST